MWIPSWMRKAIAELGEREKWGGKHNPRIIEYHSTTTLSATDDEVPWCASFVCWCLEKSGYESTQSARARSYEAWGSEVKVPIFGAIVVLERPPNPRSGHVGFYAGETNKSIWVLGGNQNNQVSYKKYPKKRLLSYRLPYGYYVRND